MANVNRIPYIDVFRGLLMLLVVLGHSIGNTDDIMNKVILSFHMPAFFMLSGMCFHPKTSNYNSLLLLKKKSKGLLWPYITFSLISVLLYWLLLAGTSKDKGVTVAETLIGILWNDGQYGTIVTGGFWFIYDLIWITIIHVLAKNINRNIQIALATISFVSLYLYKADFYFSVEIMRISAGYMFFLLGDLLVANKAEEKIEKMIRGEYLLLSIIFMAITIVTCLNNDSILMYANRYGCILLFLLSSLCGSASIYLLSRYIATNDFIEFVGRNTIPILQMHFFVLMITHVLWHKVAPHANNMEFPTYLLHFMIAVVACSLYAKAINKYFPWMLRWNYKK